MPIRLFCLILILLTACARQPMLTAELVPRSLKAINLEETISRRDELMMAYSMTSYDAQNKPVAVVNGGWGIETVKKDQQVDMQSAQPIRLPLPRNGRIVASLVLIEVDDYNQASKMMEQIRRVQSLVSGPASLLLNATEVLTPLSYVAAGLAASGIGLKLVDQLDDDDLLGQSSVDLVESTLRQQKQRLVHVPAVFTGQKMNDSFEYQLSYDITLKTVKIQPARQ